MKILCGIITYNREKLLYRCLVHIDKLTTKPDLVLIINQGNKINIKFDFGFKIKIITQQNLGSAGGWHSAIKYSLENKYKFIWLMDDDGYPDKYSLELLVKNFKNNYACLSSLVINEDNNDELVFNMPNYKNYFLPRIKKIRSLKNLNNNTSTVLYPFAHLFNGCLISLKAIETIGNITKNLYIYGEEVDYYFRLKKFGPVLTLLDSKHYHPYVRKKYTSDEKIYYWIRNTIINNNNYSKYKFIKNFITFFINIYRVLERNGMMYLIKLFSIKAKPVLIKAVIDAYKFKPKQ
tara:strand:- start:161 stop:1036 length:876 start_codon:yes stop_codon:yes gene_type:complete